MQFRIKILVLSKNCSNNNSRSIFKPRYTFCMSQPRYFIAYCCKLLYDINCMDVLVISLYLDVFEIKKVVTVSYLWKNNVLSFWFNFVPVRFLSYLLFGKNRPSYLTGKLKNRKTDHLTLPQNRKIKNTDLLTWPEDKNRALPLPYPYSYLTLPKHCSKQRKL